LRRPGPGLGYIASSPQGQAAEGLALISTQWLTEKPAPRITSYLLVGSGGAARRAPERSAGGTENCTRNSSSRHSYFEPQVETGGKVLRREPGDYGGKPRRNLRGGHRRSENQARPYVAPPAGELRRAWRGGFYEGFNSRVSRKDSPFTSRRAELSAALRGFGKFAILNHGVDGPLVSRKWWVVVGDRLRGPPRSLFASSSGLMRPRSTSKSRPARQDES